jgi:hypothetical protein
MGPVGHDLGSVENVKRSAHPVPASRARSLLEVPAFRVKLERPGFEHRVPPSSRIVEAKVLGKVAEKVGLAAFLSMPRGQNASVQRVENGKREARRSSGLAVGLGRRLLDRRKDRRRRNAEKLSDRRLIASRGPVASRPGIALLRRAFGIVHGKPPH